MEVWLWAAFVIIAVIFTALIVKIRLLQKAADEIGEAFADRLMTDTNTLIDISCRDRHMRKLADTVNVQLRTFREKRRRFEFGDMEIKNAVTNISHDLRTPLTAICGYLDLLEQEDHTVAARRYMNIIRGRASMLANLTEELFRYSLILVSEEDVSGEPLSVNAVLEDCIAECYTLLKEAGITPVIRMPDKKVMRGIARSALARVFSNLLNNAVKYSDGDLEITLSESGAIVFSNKASGLDEIQTGRLFDRFYTVEGARQSTGLGLSIARNLVERMNGSISAEYEGGRLSICILLPEHDL
ncbi:MAG: HAMP domain-containing histidine kinase [Lachnospiraceae bacterium]|nr:HAMP domain-containing histidine kinase [Lachnospiraceae bacterium]